MLVTLFVTPLQIVVKLKVVRILRQKEPRQSGQPDAFRKHEINIAADLVTGEVFVKGIGILQLDELRAQSV